VYFALIVLAVYIIWAVLFDVVLLLLVSFIFLAALEPIVERIERSGLPRGVAVLTVMLLIASMASLVAFLVVPALFTQMTDLVSNLPGIVNNLRGLLRRHGLGNQFNDQLNQIQVPSNLARHVLSAGIIVAVALVVYIWVENNILMPRIYGETLSLPPLAIFLSLIVGGKLLGFAGALLSLPLASALRVVVAYIWEVHTGRVPLEMPDEEEPQVRAQSESLSGTTVAARL